MELQVLIIKTHSYFFKYIVRVFITVNIDCIDYSRLFNKINNY